MSQMVVLGKQVQVYCPKCSRHTFEVPVMPGKQRMRCPECHYPVRVNFWIDPRPQDGPILNMDVSKDYGF